MPKRIWAVVSVGFALCMSVLDINIVNIVLPTLSHDFGTSPAVTTWIINGYQLAIVISLLSFSALGEIIGYRKVFLSGIGLFCITSLICAWTYRLPPGLLWRAVFFLLPAGTGYLLLMFR